MSSPWLCCSPPVITTGRSASGAPATTGDLRITTSCLSHPRKQQPESNIEPLCTRVQHVWHRRGYCGTHPLILFTVAHTRSSIFTLAHTGSSLFTVAHTGSSFLLWRTPAHPFLLWHTPAHPFYCGAHPLIHFYFGAHPLILFTVAHTPAHPFYCGAHRLILIDEKNDAGTGWRATAM